MCRSLMENIKRLILCSDDIFNAILKTINTIFVLLRTRIYRRYNLRQISCRMFYYSTHEKECFRFLTRLELKNSDCSAMKTSKRVSTKDIGSYKRGCTDNPRKLNYSSTSFRGVLSF